MKRRSKAVLAFATAALAGLGSGCGEAMAAHPAETTAAAMPPGVSKSDFDKVVQERDEAQALARSEDTRNGEAQQKLQTELKSRKAHDALTAKAWASIDGADSALATLQEDATKGPNAARQKSAKAAIDLKAKRAALEQHMHGIPAAVGDAWTDMEASIQRDIDALDGAVAAARAPEPAH